MLKLTYQIVRETRLYILILIRKSQDDIWLAFAFLSYVTEWEESNVLHLELSERKGGGEGTQ